MRLGDGPRLRPRTVKKAPPSYRNCTFLPTAPPSPKKRFLSSKEEEERRRILKMLVSPSANNGKGNSGSGKKSSNHLSPGDSFDSMIIKAAKSAESLHPPGSPMQQQQHHQQNGKVGKLTTCVPVLHISCISFPRSLRSSVRNLPLAFRSLPVVTLQLRWRPTRRSPSARLSIRSPARSRNRHPCLTLAARTTSS